LAGELLIYINNYNNIRNYKKYLYLPQGFDKIFL